MQDSKYDPHEHFFFAMTTNMLSGDRGRKYLVQLFSASFPSPFCVLYIVYQCAFHLTSMV